MLKRWMSNKGSTLPMVMAVLIIVVIFSVTALTIGSASIKQAENRESQLQAYYLARSGANAVSSYIVDNPDNLSETDMNDFVTNLITAGTSDPFKLDPDDSGEIRVIVTKSSEKQMLISSTAEVDGIKQTVSVSIDVQHIGKFIDKAVYLSGNFETNQNVVIDGDVAIFGEPVHFNEEEKGHCTILGTVFVEKEEYITMLEEFVAANPSKLTLSGDPDIALLEPGYTAPTFEFPEFPEEPYESSYTLTNTTINGDEDRILYTENLKLGGNVTIKRNSGTGIIKIYVKNSINFSGNDSIIGDPNLIHIYFDNTGDFEIKGSEDISATLYVKGGNITINGKTLTGYLYFWGDKISVKGSQLLANAMVYAPNAEVEFPNKPNNHSGSINARMINIKGGSITLKQVTFPFQDGSGSGSMETTTTYTIGQWQ